MTTTPDSPAAELRQAALTLKVRADCGPGSVWSALADWLDETAKNAEEGVELEDAPECVHQDAPHDCGPMVPTWACDCCGEYLIPGGCTCWDKPLAVARAVLDGAR